MTKREAYEHLSGSWGAAESEFGDTGVNFEDCLRVLGVATDVIEAIQHEQEAETQAIREVELEEAEEMVRDGVFVRKAVQQSDDMVWYFPYSYNAEFFDRDPDEFRHRRDRIILKYKDKKVEAKEEFRRRWKESHPA